MPASYGPPGKGKKVDFSSELLSSAGELSKSFAELSVACQDAAKSVSSLGSASASAAANLAKISQLKQITVRDVEKTAKEASAKVSEKVKAEAPVVEEARGLPSISQLVANLNSRVEKQAEELSKALGEKFLESFKKENLTKGLVSIVDPDRLTRDMLTMESGEDLANGILEIAGEIQSKILEDMEAARDALAAEKFIAKMQENKSYKLKKEPIPTEIESESDLLSGALEIAGEVSNQINAAFQEMHDLKINAEISKFADLVEQKINAELFEQSVVDVVDSFDPIASALEAAAEHARRLESVIDEDLIAGIDEISNEISAGINKGFEELRTIDRYSPKSVIPDYKEEKAAPISTTESLAMGFGFGGGNIGMLANLAGPIGKGLMKAGEVAFNAASAFSEFAVKAVSALDPSLAFRLGIAVKDLYATFGIALKPLVESFVEGIRLIADYLTPVVKRLSPIFEEIGDTLTVMIEGIMPWISLLIEGLTQAVGILNRWIIGPLAEAFKYFTKMIFWTSDYNEKGSSVGAAAMKASYSGIAEYGKNIMQQAMGSSSGITASLKTAEHTRRTVELLEELVNKNKNEPWERDGAGLKWVITPTTHAGAMRDMEEWN